MQKMQVFCRKNIIKIVISFVLTEKALGLNVRRTENVSIRVHVLHI